MATRWSLRASRQLEDVLPYATTVVRLAIPLVGVGFGFWLRSKIHHCRIERDGIRIEET